MAPAAAPVRMRRPRPSREQILEAREARRLRHRRFVSSLLCAVGAGVVLHVSVGAPWHPAIAWIAPVALLPGIVLGVLAGPRIWPANVLVVILSITTVAFFTPWIGGAIVATALSVLVFGYASRGLWSLSVHGRFWMPLGPEGDVPRGGGGVHGDGHSYLRLKKPTVAVSTPPEKAFRTRWWW